MSIRQKLSCFGLVLVSLSTPCVADVITADWQRAKQDKGVEVFTGEVVDSKFLAFKAITVIPAPLEAVLAAITDQVGYPEWYDNCKETEVIEYSGPDTAIVRIVIKTPFPLANREAVNQVSVTRVAGGAIVDLKSVPEAQPPVRGLVRMEQASGTWELQETEQGTRVIHTYHADPKAKVPAWIMNRFVVDGPINSLSELAAYIARIQLDRSS